MAIFTQEELTEQITAYKAALKALAAAQSYTVSTAGTSRTYTRADLPEIRNTLEWLQREQRKLNGTAGAVTVIGRPAR